MLKNIGSADRIIRIVIGLAVVAAGVLFKSWWGLIGLVPLATATMSWCPLYGVCKIATTPARKP